VPDYIEFREIRAAMPRELTWTEADLIRIGHRGGGPLPYVRCGNRKTSAMWKRADVIAWFENRYHQAPEMIAYFKERLKPAKKYRKQALA
jgi:hypothetical protein